jgi:hypothetical protein
MSLITTESASLNSAEAPTSEYSMAELVVLIKLRVPLCLLYFILELVFLFGWFTSVVYYYSMSCSNQAFID